MGFGKKTEASEDTDESSEKRTAKKEREGGTKRDDGFVPSTSKQLKEYGKRSREKEKAAKAEREARKEGKEKLPRLNKGNAREQLVARARFRVYKTNFFDELLKEAKEQELPKPRYKAYLDKKEADTDFMFQINGLLSRLNWTVLHHLVYTAVSGGSEQPLNLPTRSWSEAFRFCQHCVHLALGVEEVDGVYRLTDRDALEEWPVEERKRKSKGDSEMFDKFNEEENRKLLAGAKDDDEEDDDADEEGDDDSDDEDEDEEEEGDDDEDDKRKPKKGKSAASDGKRKGGKEKDKKTAKGKKSSKKEEKSSKKDDEKPKKVKLDDSTKVSKVGKRDKGGKKTDFLELIPKSGIKIKELAAKAKEIGVGSGKIKPWLLSFERYGYVKFS